MRIMKTTRGPRLRPDLLVAARGLARLERLVATVKGRGKGDTKFDAALDILDTLARREGIPIAIIGGMAAIYHGYERLTKDIDVVVGKAHLDSQIRVAPRYGIKVIWQDPKGWHKLRYGGVDIEIIPEGGEPGKQAPATIPGVKQLGVDMGAEYATLEGWIETKLASNRIQDRADVVRVIKNVPATAIRRIKNHLAAVHRTYLKRFEELHATALEEKKQEQDRGGPR